MFVLDVPSISFAIRSAVARLAASMFDTSSLVVYRFSSNEALTLNFFSFAEN